MKVSMNLPVNQLTCRKIKQYPSEGLAEYLKLPGRHCMVQT